MCGRFANNERIESISQRFAATSAITDEDWAPTWNAKPTDRLPVVIQDAKGRRLGLMGWGWPQDWNPRGLHVNAIGETAAEKPSFAEAFAKRRCIVPATAFYEWRAEGREKLPYAFQVAGGGLFGIAGLWRTIEVGGRREARFILLTTVANQVVSPVHHRMAAMLPTGAESLWLDPAASAEQVRGLLAAYEATAMTFHRVSKKVNGVKQDGPDLLKPIRDEDDGGGLP